MEICLTFVEQRRDGSMALRLRLCDEAGHREHRSLTLTAADWRDMGLAPEAGQMLTEQQFERLEQAGELCAALNKGAELLSYGACSRRALEQKLRQRGYEAELCVRVVDELCRRGLIREQDEARAVVRVCLRSGYGPARILAKLRQKGYGDEAIRVALGEVDEDSYIEGCARMICKKYGTLPQETAARQRAIGALVRLGYSTAQIRRAAETLREQESGEP